MQTKSLKIVGDPGFEYDLLQECVVTADKIRKRCWKVYIHVENNHIFDYGLNQYDFVSAFREREPAELALSSQLQLGSSYGKRPTACKRVVGFYLVPISKIDNDERNLRKLDVK